MNVDQTGSPQPSVPQTTPQVTAHTSATAWSTADKLQLANDIATGLAGCAALLAAIVASRALKQQIAAPRRDRRSIYYRAVVLDTALASLTKFEEDASQLLEAGEREVREQLAANDSASQAQARTGRLIDDYKAHLRPLRFRLLRASNAWRDEQLRADLSRTLDATEDGVTERIPLILTGQTIDPSLLDSLGEGVSGILAVLIDYDLGLDDSDRKSASESKQTKKNKARS